MAREFPNWQIPLSNYYQPPSPPHTYREDSPGKNGQLLLEISPRGVVKQQAKAPLSMSKMLRLEPNLPTTWYGYIRSIGGGIAQYDRHQITLHTRPSAHAVFTSQAASRIHRMDTNYGLQQVTLHADKSSVLEYFPDAIIPSQNSRFRQVTDIFAHDDATILTGDLFTAGRIAHGELFDLDWLEIRTTASRHSDSLQPHQKHLVLREQARFDSRRQLTSPINHHTFSCWATLLVLPPRAWQNKRQLTALRDALRHTADAVASDTLIGTSTLPYDAGCWARIFGSRLPEVERAQFQLWSTAREILLGRPAVSLRKM